MLAQNFKTSADLNLTDPEFEALVKFLGMLDRGEVRHVPVYDDLYGHDKDPTPKTFHALFNMENVWTRAVGDCGTAGCIAGNCDLLFGTEFAPRGDIRSCGMPSPLLDLFIPNGIAWRRWKSITVEQTAIALRNYLTHGEPRWAEALAG